MASPIHLSKSMIPSDEIMLANFLAWYALAQRDSESFNRNFNWYRTANRECQELADFVQLSLHTVCQVVSCLSPGKRWTLNIADAESLIHVWKEIPDNETRCAALQSIGFSVGYTWENALNAFHVLDTGQDIPPTREKTYNFAGNLEFPDSPDYCTVDQHMIHILTGTGLKGSINPNKNYGRLQRVIIVACTVLGILPSEGQAAAWGFRVDSFEAGLSVDSLMELVQSILSIGEIL